MPGTPQRSGRLVVLVVALVAVAACGTDSGVRSRRADDVTIPTTSTVEVTTTTTSTSTTVPAITLPSTTMPPSTTVAPTFAPTTTVEPTTTIAGVAAGWTDGALPAGMLDGCCEDLWTGTPSPPFPDDPNAALPDGIYSACVAAPWTSTQPNQLTIDVYRIEQCSVIGGDACYGGPYVDSDVSTAPEPVRTYTVTLDQNVAITLGGFDVCSPVTKHGNGNDLVGVLQAFDTAYQSVIAGPLTSGATQDDIVASLGGGPVQGFEVADPTCLAGLLEFRTGDAPPLLLQVLTDYREDGTSPPLTPTDLVHLVSLDQHDGLTTLGFYAGFYS